MDRLKDRLAALAEEVGELAQPPGVAVTVWRARRRRRAVGLVAVGLLAVVVVGLAVPIVLPGWGTGQGGLGASQGARTTAGPPTATGSPGPFGPLMVTGGGRVAAGDQLAIRGEGCFPVEPGTVSLPRTGIRKSVPINGDGSFFTQARHLRHCIALPYHQGHVGTSRQPRGHTGCPRASWGKPLTHAHEVHR